MRVTIRAKTETTPVSVPAPTRALISNPQFNTKPLDCMRAPDGGYSLGFVNEVFHLCVPTHRNALQLASCYCTAPALLHVCSNACRLVGRVHTSVSQSLAC